MARTPIILLCGLVLLTSGCSYSYQLLLQGLVIDNTSQSPVAGAKITMFAGKSVFGTAESDAEGKWEFTESLSDGEFFPDSEGNRVLRTDSKFPRQIRIEYNTKNYTINYPTVSMPKGSPGNTQIHAFVLTELNVNPDLHR